MIPLKPILNYLSIFVVGLLSVPSLAILVTWNALPGDRLYPVKRNLENMALKIVGNNLQAQTALRSQFINRRFNEAFTLIAKSSSTEGLTELTVDVQAAKEVIVTADNPQERKVAAQQLIIQLSAYNQKLEQKKLAYAPSSELPIPESAGTSSTVTTAPPPVTAPTVSYTPTVPSHPQSQPPAPPQPEVAQEINQTQQELNQVIQELQKVTVASPQQPGRPENAGQSRPERKEDQENKDKSKDHQSDQNKPQESESHSQGQKD